MKKRFLILAVLVLCALTLSACGSCAHVPSGTDDPTEDIGSVDPSLIPADSTANPADTPSALTNVIIEGGGTTADIGGAANTAPETHEDYVPIHADETTSYQHIDFPDWSKIKQPAIPELDEIRNTPGKLKPLGEAVKKRAAAEDREDFYDNAGNRVYYLSYRNGKAFTKVTFEYYAGGQVFTERQYNVEREEEPVSLTAYAQDGSYLLLGDYSSGHLVRLTYMDKGLHTRMLEFYESAATMHEVTYYNGRNAKETEYFEDGEIRSYTEYDDAGNVYYNWNKYYYDEGAGYSYSLYEEKDGLVTTTYFDWNGNEVFTEKKENGNAYNTLLFSRECFYDYTTKQYTGYRTLTYNADTNQYVAEYSDMEGSVYAREYYSFANGQPGELLSVEAAETSAPDPYAGYEPVTPEDLADFTHSAYPDWTQIKQPAVPELDEIRNTPGMLKKPGTPVRKYYDESYGYTYFYDEDGNVVFRIEYSNGVPFRKHVFEYYADGSMFTLTEYDCEKEGQPLYVDARRPDGSCLLDITYSEGHLYSVNLIEGSRRVLSRYYSEKALLTSEYDTHDENLTKASEYSESGEKINYVETNELTHEFKSWRKTYYDLDIPGDIRDYCIVEEDGKVSKQKDYDKDGFLWMEEESRMADGYWQLLNRKTYYYDNEEHKYTAYYTEVYEENWNRFREDYYSIDGSLVSTSFFTNSNGIPGEEIKAS